MNGFPKEEKFDKNLRSGQFLEHESEKTKNGKELKSATSPNEIPEPLLKIALERLGSGNKQAQYGFIQSVWVLLFGDRTATTTKAPGSGGTATTTAPGAGGSTTTKAPGDGGTTDANVTGSGNMTINQQLAAAARFNASLIDRTRRPTKYMFKGNCKNPPTKLPDTEYD